MRISVIECAQTLCTYKPFSHQTHFSFSPKTPVFFHIKKSIVHFTRTAQTVTHTTRADVAYRLLKFLPLN